MKYGDEADVVPVGESAGKYIVEIGGNVKTFIQMLMLIGVRVGTHVAVLKLRN